LFPDLFSALLSEKLDKQFVTKLPYAFMLSLAVFLPFHLTGEPYRDIAIIFAIISIILFFILNTIFSSKVQRWINESFFGGDLFHQTKPIYSEVVDKGYSPIGNIEASKSRLLILGAIGGAALTTFFVAAFLLIIDRMEVGLEALLAMGAIASLLIYYDLMKSPMETDDPSIEARKDKNPVAYGVLEKFLLTNSAKKMPRVTVPVWRLLIRLCGPVLHIKPPKIGYKEVIVYADNELQNKFCEFCNKERDAEILLQHATGLNESALVLEENHKKSERIHLLAQRKPIENFPYLYGLKQDTQHKVWGLFRIVNPKAKSKPLGQLYLHIFKGLRVTHRLRQIPDDNPHKAPDRMVKTDSKGDPIERKFEKDVAVFLFILVGERTTVEYFATELKLSAAEFPRDLMSIEWNQK
jgi:hypothetical protein